MRGLGTEGDGAVVLADGSVVLARNVLPGERVRIERVGRGHVQRARVDAILEPSSGRVAAPCVYAAQCGGCPLMIATFDLATDIKRERVRRALGLDVPLQSPIQQLGYRHRARLAFARTDAGVELGYRAEGSRSIVDVAHCLVLCPILEAGLAMLRERALPLVAGTGEIRVAVSRERPTVCIESRDAQPPTLYTLLDGLVREGVIAGATLLAGGASAPAAFGDRWSETRDFEGRTLRAPLGGFAQAHAEHNRALSAFAIDAAAPDGARVLELFAGHGNFTLALATRAETTTAVELDAEATRCLAHNLETNGAKAKVITDDAARACAAIKRGTIDVVLLDPPREGARDAMAPLVALGPSRITYVSCSPESLARDATMLVAGGYTMTRARAFDMFPQTSHVEVVALFERAGIGARPSGAVAPGGPRR